MCDAGSITLFVGRSYIMFTGHTELWLKLSDVFVKVGKYDEAVSFVLLFVWLAGWYMLYQMFRLSFLKWIIAGDLLYVLVWLVDHRHQMFDHEDTLQTLTFFLGVGNTLSFAATILCAIGVCLGIRFLQRKRAERNIKVVVDP